MQEEINNTENIDNENNIVNENDNNNNDNKVDPATETGVKTYTEDEVKELLKDYISKDKVNEIVQKEKGKAKKKADEAERLSQLTREQLLAEIDALNAEKEKLANERDELEALKQEANRISKENSLNKLKIEVKNSLSANGLGEEYFDLVFNENATAEDITAKIQQLSKLINVERKKEKESIVKNVSKTPKANISNNVMTDKEKFKKMNLFERQQLKNNNFELYKKLAGK